MRLTALAGGAVALVLGVAAPWVGTSALLLAVFVVAIVATWGMGELAAQSYQHTPIRHV